MSTLDQYRLGYALKSKRSGLDLNLREVAAATGISTSTLSRVENGKGHLLQIDTFLALCDWLGADPASFIVPGTEANSAPEMGDLEEIEVRLRACLEAPALCKAIAEVIRLIRLEQANS
jgi:transcriptional regulator with XRE-family HTH domain